MGLSKQKPFLLHKLFEKNIKTAFKIFCDADIITPPGRKKKQLIRPK